MDVFSSVIIYLGHDPNQFDPKDVAAASEVLRKIRPFIRYIDPASTSPTSRAVALAWRLPGPAMRAQARSRAIEANTGAHVAYIVPREVALITLDMMVFPDALYLQRAHVAELFQCGRRDGRDHQLYQVPERQFGAPLPLGLADLRTDESIYPNVQLLAHGSSPRQPYPVPLAPDHPG